LIYSKRIKILSCTSVIWGGGLIVGIGTYFKYKNKDCKIK
jgi:hypothetical protein